MVAVSSGIGSQATHGPTAKGLNTIYAWIVTFALLQALDVGVTAYALGSSSASEFNPLALSLYNFAGSYGLAMAKAIGTGFIVAVCYWVWLSQPKIARVGQTVAMTLMAAVVVNNLWVVLR